VRKVCLISAQAGRDTPCWFDCGTVCKRRLAGIKRPSAFPGLSFELPLSDSGSGAVSTALLTGAGAATFTRATAGAAKLSTGLWKLDVASGVARSTYLGLDTAVGAYAGYLAEGARTNRCLWARDLTNAAWTATSVTVAKDATGIDGVANSASTLTATGANGTVLQAITSASVARVYGAWVRRKTGTGNVFITLDNDTTRTDITASINSTTYTLVQATQTLANPTVGFKIETSGDAIEVDVCQEETGAFASTPIPTTTAAVTRNADVLTYTFAGNASASAGACYAELSSLWATSAASQNAIGFSTALVGPLCQSSAVASTAIGCRMGAPIVTKTGLTNMNTGVRKRAASWDGATAQTVTGDGAAVATGAYTAGATTGIGIGCAADGSSQWFGTIKNVRIWKDKLSNNQLVDLTRY
jgi:hypothetical protein